LIERLRNDSGYSVVEVLVAIMLLSIAIIPMASMFDAGFRAALLGGNYDKARATASEELEEIKGLPYDTSGDGTDDSVVEIYPSSGSPHSCTTLLHISNALRG
jgi:hypothetical protein